jgi:L-amino acid N-acyltransferase YncA
MPYIIIVIAVFCDSVHNTKEFSSRITSCLTRFPWLLAKHPTLGIVGYAYATSYKARAAYRWTVETSVYVSSKCHRKQVGSKLYKCLFLILTHLNLHSIFVCIGVPNDKSIGFHKRLGFEDAGLFRRAGFKRGRWIDSMWLQKHLPDGEDNLSAEEPYTEDLDKVIPEPLGITSLSAEEVTALIRQGQGKRCSCCSGMWVHVHV